MTKRKERRQLLPVELLAANTAEVESFASYLHRQMFHHNLSYNDFTNMLYELPNKKAVKKNRRYYVTPSLASLVRQSEKTLTILGKLESLAKQELSSSIFCRVWHELFPRDTFTLTFRWCSDCFGEFEALGVEPYFKLAWHILDIKICPLHRSTLREICECCKSQQQFGVRKNPVNYCQSCGGQLSLQKQTAVKSTSLSDWFKNGLDIYEFLFDLIVWSSSFPVDLNHRNVVGRLKFLCKHKPDFLTAIASVKNRSSGNQTFPVVRDGARALGKPIYLFYSGLFSGVDRHRHHKEYVFLRNVDDKEVRKLNISNFEKVSFFFERGEKNSSVLDFCIATNSRVDEFKSRYPAFFKIKELECVRLKKVEKLNKINAMKALVLKLLVDRKYLSVFSNKLRAYRELRLDCGLSRRELRQVIVEVVSAVHH